MPVRSLGWSPFVALLVLLAGLFAVGAAAGPPSEAAPATLSPQATVLRGTERGARSPTVLGDINNDGLVDIRDYGLWRQAFGATNCGNAADLNGDCIVDIRDYGIWRQNFGQTGPTLTPTSAASGTPTSTVTATSTSTPTSTVTATPTLPGRAYVANSNSNNVSVIDTTTNAVVGTPIPVGPGGTGPDDVGVDPTVHRAYVVNFNSNNVTVIDTIGNTVVGAPITVGTGPQGVGIGP